MSSYNECNKYEECKAVALDKLKDAVALLKAERYTGTLYMAGYVMEIAIKAEFFRLANKEVSFDGNKFRKAMNDLVLVSKKEPSKETKKWLEESSFPPKTYREFLIFLQKIADFHSSLKDVSAFSIFIENRYPKQKEGTFHDIKGFRNELQKWKERLDDEQSFNSERYELLDWDVKIRYSNKETSADDAKESVRISLNFLKDVLKIRNELLTEIERELEPTNEDQEYFNEDQME